MVAITRLGDMLQMSPTIAGLKQENPDARITVVIEKQFAKICSGIPGIDDVYVLDLGFVCRCLHREQEGIAEAYEYISKAVADLRERNFDYCLNMSNSAYTALLIKMLNVSENRGWLADDEGFRLMADPWAMLFAAFVYHSNRDFNSLNLVDIFRCSADVREHPLSLQYRATPEARAFAESFIANAGLTGDGPLICIQAGASQRKRQWAPLRFSKVTDLLIERLGARVIYTGAPSESDIIDEAIAGCRFGNVISAAGKTNFDQLAAILEQADLLITGDTGPMHLSVAVGTPVVALFLASALAFETGPYSAGNFVLQPQISCNPCNPNYPCARPDCHDQITPELVAYLAQLRIETPLDKDSQLRIPSDVAHPAEVIVYRTTFDEDGFLDHVSMNGLQLRHSEPAGYYETARAAYRALWKESFAGIRFSPLPQVVQAPIEVHHPSLKGIERIVALTTEGRATLRQLLPLIDDPSAPAHLLGGINQKLQSIDREIEEVALSHPICGALVRIFVMEKENLRGDNARQLAAATDSLYTRLAQRSERFGRLFSYFWENRLSGLAAEEREWAVRSSASRDKLYGIGRGDAGAHP